MCGIMLCVGPVFAGFKGNNVQHVAAVPEKVVEHKNLNSKGGFVDGSENIVTVIQVEEMRDDTPVIVTGYILQRTGDEKYLFEDNSGTIVVEIDDENWNGQTVTPKDNVKLYGDVDKGLFKTEIDVDYIDML